MPGIDDKAKLAGKDKSKFVDSTPTLTTAFQKITIGFNASDFVISNDHASQYIEYSFDGTTVHGKLLSGEVIPEYGVSYSNIWMRGEIGGEGFRIWASG